MSREELLAECQRVRTLRTSPPTLVKALSEDSEIQDVFSESGGQAKATKRVAPSISIDALIAASNKFAETQKPAS